ncbi:MAG TPA: DUF4386 domain-containing protein [Acidimicrobiales bacterium]|nr:DUF4386 domain-containing protein [Acidimicrobiales bacterium]
MRSRDVRATAAGVLFIIATGASLTATGLLGSALDGPGFLTDVSLHQDRLLAAALFQLVAAFSSAAIAITFYPVLKEHSAGTALGAVAFRLIEGVFYALSATGTLVLVALSEQVAAAATASSSLQASAELLRSLRDAAGVVGVLAFYTGATAYYLVFYRSRLIPRWLSAWGLAGTALGLVAGLLVLFQVVGTLSGVQVAFNLPIGVQEMVLAAWLIARGFSSPAPRPVLPDRVHRKLVSRRGPGPSPVLP